MNFVVKYCKKVKFTIKLKKNENNWRLQHYDTFSANTYIYIR